MNLPEALATAVLVSLSGVISPGPLTAVTLSESRNNKFAGVLIATGHAIVEIPIIVLLFVIGSQPISPILKAAISIVGGVVLIVLAYVELKAKNDKTSSESVPKVSSLVLGSTMTLLNPFFIIWWFTTGFRLILPLIPFGITGLLLFTIAHELCDFSWLSFLSLSANKAIDIWGEKTKKFLTILSVSIMIVFGMYFIYSGLSSISYQ